MSLPTLLTLNQLAYDVRTDQKPLVTSGIAPYLNVLCKISGQESALRKVRLKIICDFADGCEIPERH